jgi:hypothetical protein
MRLFFRQEFETRSHARSLAAARRGFVFYVACPVNSIHPPPDMRYGVAGEIIRNEATTESALCD